MLTLNRLDRRDRTVLVEQIAGGKALPGEVIAQIVDRTDGVPLFVEVIDQECTRERSVAGWHLDHSARLADGTARPSGIGASGGADWCRDRPRVGGNMSDSTLASTTGGSLNELAGKYCVELERLNYGA